jgi:hypothetical protein
MAKAMWIAFLTYFGLIAIPVAYGSIEPTINWVDVQPMSEEQEWAAYHIEATNEYMDEFTALFNAIEFKRAKNGRSMVKGINDKSFKFAKKGI